MTTSLTPANPRRKNDFHPFWGSAGQGQGPPLETAPRAQVAQSVEQWIENPRVGSSILSLGTISPFAFVRASSDEFKFFNEIRLIYSLSVQARPLEVWGSRLLCWYLCWYLPNFRK